MIGDSSYVWLDPAIVQRLIWRHMPERADDPLAALDAWLDAPEVVFYRAGRDVVDAEGARGE